MLTPSLSPRLGHYYTPLAPPEGNNDSPGRNPTASAIIADAHHHHHHHHEDEDDDDVSSPSATPTLLRSSLDLDADEMIIIPAAAAGAQQSDSNRTLKRSLTYLNGLALVLGLQIGSGIFSAPSQVGRHVPSPGAAVLVWLVAGLLVWTGAASFIELGVAIPDNGGVQEYLRICYGDFLGFLFSWVWVTIAKPSAVAMIAMVFADNVGMVVSRDGGRLALWMEKMVAVVGIWVVTFVNCLGARTGAQAANGFLILKLFAILSIGITGLVIGIFGLWKEGQRPDVEWFGGDPDPVRQEFSIWKQVGEYVTAVYGALFCYGGWESVRSNCYSIYTASPD